MPVRLVGELADQVGVDGVEPFGPVDGDAV